MCNVLGGSDAQSFVSFTGCTTMQCPNARRSAIGVSEQLNSHTTEIFPSNLALERTKIAVLEKTAYLLIDLKCTMIPRHSIRYPFTVAVSHTGRLYKEVHIPHDTALHEADPKPFAQNCGQSDTRRGFPCQLSFHQCSILLFY